MALARRIRSLEGVRGRDDLIRLSALTLQHTRLDVAMKEITRLLLSVQHEYQKSDDTRHELRISSLLGGQRAQIGLDVMPAPRARTMARSLVGDTVVDAGSYINFAVQHVDEAGVTAMPGKADAARAPDFQRAFKDLP